MQHENQPVADRMQALAEQWQAAADRRAVFLNCYLLMTRNMLAALEAGEFLDRFAGFYFDALAAYEQGDPSVPPVWRITHDAALQPGTAVLQDLMLGVNAHINYDLVLAVAELMAAEWQGHSEDTRRRRYEDYCHVNAVVARTVDAVQDRVVETLVPWLAIVDTLLGPLDEDLADWMITRWRDEVWGQAVRLIETPESAAREELRRKVEADTVERAKAILLQDGPVGIARLL
jgi:hypothetical protein